MAGMPPESDENTHSPLILGFDPGRSKCGLAVMAVDHTIHWHQVVTAQQVIESINSLCEIHPISLLVMGNQTTSHEWHQKLLEALVPNLRITKVDERYSTLEARTKYWQIFPPQGMHRFIPESLRPIRHPIDDIVAIILIERFLNQLADKTTLDA